jgi:hypothetical protein
MTTPALRARAAEAREEAVEAREEAVEAVAAPPVRPARVEARTPVSMRAEAPVEAGAALAKEAPREPLAQRVRAARQAARERVERPGKMVGRATLQPMATVRRW